MRRILRTTGKLLRLADRALEVLLFDVLLARGRRGLVLGAAALAGALLLLPGRASAPLQDEDLKDRDKLLVGRPWLDHVPQDDYDPFRALIFEKKKNVGVSLQSTAYRGQWELFVFKARDGKHLEIFFPHEKRKVVTGYSISKTKHGNFDLQLDLEDPPLGPRTYYSWKDRRGSGEVEPALRELALERWLLPMEQLTSDLSAEAE